MPPKKQKEEKIDSLIENIDIVSVNNNEVHMTNPLVGLEVSLDLARESFFGVGPIWLSPKKYSCVIPDNLTSDQLLSIKRALERGVLVKGNTYLPAHKRDPGVLDEYWSLIKQFGLEAIPQNKSYPKFKKLLKYGIDRNWTAKEIAKYCIENEKKYKNREKIIRLLTELLKISDAPDTLVDNPNN